MAQKKAPETLEEFSKSKFFTLFNCNKKVCAQKSLSSRMISQSDLLALLKGKDLTKRYGKVHSTQMPDKERS